MNQKRAKALRKLIGYTPATKGSYNVEMKKVRNLPYSPKRFNRAGVELFFKVQSVQVTLKPSTTRSVYQKIKRGMHS